MKIRNQHFLLINSLLTVVLLCSCAREDASSDAVNTKTSPEISRATDMEISSPIQSAVSEDNWRLEYGARNEKALALGDARTLEEAQWLKRKGFLSASRRDELSKLSPQALKQLVETGDEDATLFVGDILVKQKRGQEALPYLSRLALKKASIPALYLKAKHYANELNASEDVGEAQSIRQEAGSALLTAYLLGDYKAGQLLYSIYEKGVPPVIFSEAMRTVQEMQRINARNHQPALRIDARPMPSSAHGVNDSQEDFWRSDKLSW